MTTKIEETRKIAEWATIEPYNRSSLELKPEVTIEIADYPKINVINSLHLHIIKKYAERAHKYARMGLFDDMDKAEGVKLHEEYIAILNYSSSRIFANSGAMMMPSAFKQWDGVQFSDKTRMVTHAIVHNHYRYLWTGDPEAHATIQEIMAWCATVGIKTTQQTLRTTIDDGVVQGMFSYVPASKGNEKGVAPTFKAIDMYQASCCLYAVLLWQRWMAGKDYHRWLEQLVNEIDANETISVYKDVAVIARGVCRSFSEEGIDFVDINPPLPRFTAAVLTERAHSC